ncbi:MAG: hypothetical protein KGL63_13575 [Betaproteobacteria bacterium]|nr:hypothetical protein [Betaproteobacteria bacterium]
MKLTREIYIPTGAVKVSDKNSDAVAYLFDNTKGKPAAMMFYGKQAKPVWHFWFDNATRREGAIKAGFEKRQAATERKAALRAEDKAKTSGLVVGDILVSSWGYDQTNIDYYQVTAIHGKNSVTIRPIAAASKDTGYMTGESVPQSGAFIGEPMRKMARDGRVRITSFSSARKWNTATVAGVPVGPKNQWTAYA